MRAEKRKFEQDLETTKTKCFKVEENLLHAHAFASYWKNRFKNVVKSRIKKIEKTRVHQSHYQTTLNEVST